MAPQLKTLWQINKYYFNDLVWLLLVLPLNLPCFVPNKNRMWFTRFCWGWEAKLASVLFNFFASLAFMLIFQISQIRRKVHFSDLARYISFHIWSRSFYKEVMGWECRWSSWRWSGAIRSWDLCYGWSSPPGYSAPARLEINYWGGRGEGGGLAKEHWKGARGWM